MLNKILKRKLNNNEGASLMVALLFFVMCATIGSIILAAATASSGRVKNLKADDQAYYVNSSAVNLLGDILSDSNNAIVIKRWMDTGTECVIENGTDYIPSIVKSNITTTNIDSTFSQYNTDSSGIAPHGSPQAFNIVIKRQDGSEIDAMKVNANVYITDSYDLIIKLEPELFAENTMTVVFKSVKKIEEGFSVREEEPGKQVKVKIYTLYWQKPEVYEGVLPS